MNAVTEFHKHYHKKILSRPELYQSNSESIDVILPNSLIEWANASSGHSGFGAGARARGIRRNVNNSSKALKEIFKTPESLAKFIMSSECDGVAYVESYKQKYAQKNGIRIATNITPVNPLDMPVRTTDLNKVYGQGTIQSLMAKYPKTVRTDFAVLTVGEFEARYNLSTVAKVA